MLSKDGHNCSILKRFNDIDLWTKTKAVKNLLNFYLSVYKSFENTGGSGEIAHNEQFLLLPQCFLPNWKT